MSKFKSHEQIFLNAILEERKEFLLKVSPLACRRARRRTMVVNNVEPWLGRLSIVLWSLVAHKIFEWQEGKEDVPETYRDWEVDVVTGKKEGDENHGEVLYTYGFIAQLLCLWWQGTSLTPLVSLSDRVTLHITELVEKLYSGIDPFPNNVNDSDEKLKDDPLLSSTVSLLKKLRTALNAQKDKIWQFGIGEGRLGRYWEIDSRIKENDTSRHEEGTNKTIVPVDYCDYEDYKKNPETPIKSLNKALEKSKKGEFCSYDIESKMVYDPYNGEKIWALISDNRGQNWSKNIPRRSELKPRIATIVEVCHEVRTTQFKQFVTAIDHAIDRNGICLIEDVFYLHHSVERDFCLYRSDEIAALFKIFGYDTIDVPCWTANIAAPYSIVLATKSKKTCKVFIGKKIEKLIGNIRERMSKRLSKLMEIWRYRTMHPNEIREHFYTIHSLANLIRWDYEKRQKEKQK